MTQDEARAKSQDKVNAIENICRQMQVSVSAEQVLTKEGFIKNIVYYTDNERYAIDEEKTSNTKQDEEPIKKTTNLRKKNIKNSI